MAPKSLILYSSWTGNTEKVAFRFQKVFEEKGWSCDLFKADRKVDIANPTPIDFDSYDFLCVGSPVILSMPTEEIINIMVKNPASAHHGEPTREELVRLSFQHNDPDYRPPGPPRPRGKAGTRPVAKLVPGPKKGIVFVTYAGIHLGPKEAAPALSQLELELEHLRFMCIGSFACPGKHGNDPGNGWWHGDLRHRPNERDLLKAEIFMEEKIEECS